MFDSRSVPFDSWWNTLTDDERTEAHCSIGCEVNTGLRNGESFVEAEIVLIEAELSDGDGSHRAPNAEPFRVNAHKVLDDFVADHELAGGGRCRRGVHDKQHRR